ncbi:hypothetical protein B0H67DRAFT_643335 [Lasiosphaeris hirsuta]|uniref:Uncharacterized protein n=1 Tax=Lasiosphaeris hirsuta TaxID=260670 RepID=A0AA40DY88_9PEZI|nr:hypothetical protein B0H67DRAFT_643335 [Lasiosphaeris hirsuta]
MSAKLERSQSRSARLSQKLRDLARLKLKTEDKEQQPLQSKFQIIHTPDRLTRTRPTPSAEECREEIRSWHRAADEARRRPISHESLMMITDDDAVRETRGGRGRRDLSDRYWFRDSDEEEESKHTPSPTSSKTQDSPPAAATEKRGGGHSDDEDIKGKRRKMTFMMEDVVTGVDLLGESLRFYPPLSYTPNPVFNRLSQSPTKSEGYFGPGKWEVQSLRSENSPSRGSARLPPSPPSERRRGYSVPHRPASPSITSLSCLSELSFNEEQVCEAQVVDKSQLMHRRGVCLHCGHALAKTGTVRCGRCGKDRGSGSMLFGRPNEIQQRKREVRPLESAGTRRPTSPMSPRSPPRPPPLLRERRYLEWPRASQEQVQHRRTSSQTRHPCIGDSIEQQLAKHVTPPRGVSPDPGAIPLPLSPIKTPPSMKEGEGGRERKVSQESIASAIQNAASRDGSEPSSKPPKAVPSEIVRDAEPKRGRNIETGGILSRIHRWQPPEQRATVEKQFEQDGEVADVLVDIYDAYANKEGESFPNSK